MPYNFFIEQKPIFPGASTPVSNCSPLVCVVANPAKPQVNAATQQHITAALQKAGYPNPLWLETTPTQTGTAQAQWAVKHGASLVIAAGGDGTVRAVAAGLAGTPTALGILPLGTANVAARNLKLPVNNLDALLQIAIAGTGKPTDLAWVYTLPNSAIAPREADLDAATFNPPQPCLVVAGIGFDAQLVASTNPVLKPKLKWGAYALAGLHNLHCPRLKLSVHLTPPSPTDRVVTSTAPASISKPEWETVTARCFLIANAGRLPAGINLIPSAAMDDGKLDIAIIDTVGGLAGWSSLARQVLLPSRSTPRRHTLGRLTLRQSTAVSVRLAQPTVVEVDGDLLPPTYAFKICLQPAAVNIKQSL